MLARNTYDRKYIDACQARIDADLKALGDAADPRLYSELVLVLDYCFVHRTRKLEGKGESVLKSVREMATSMLEESNVVAMDAAAFRELADAYFDELRSKFAA